MLLLRRLPIIFVSLFIFGCATIGSGPSTLIVRSEPSGAKVVIEGEVRSKTPANILLEPHKFSGKSIYIRKNGYKEERAKLSTKISTPYVVLDIILGVFPLFIDGYTEEWRIFEKENFNFELSPERSIADNTSVDKKSVEPKEKTEMGENAKAVFGKNGKEKSSKNNDKKPKLDVDIPNTSLNRPKDVAVVLGNKVYESKGIPNVEYAIRDARVVKKYLTVTLGFREENIIYVENATAADLTRIFGSKDDPKGQLYNWVKPGQSDVFVYYSGHGAPNPESGNTYFIPSNTNPSYLSQNGYPVNQLYENLAEIPANSVTVVMEACFSGTSDGGAVVQEISPAVLSVENPVMSIENGLVFTAATGEQVSTWYSEKKHGLFTYYFLKGLRGNADQNSNRAVTAKEMESYLKEKVPYRARRMHNREQT
ncbi:MAG: caspase domain-containing protein, partial [Candidatus Paceibacteria bacterium]